jgi:hypothetical protein
LATAARRHGTRQGVRGAAGLAGLCRGLERSARAQPDGGRSAGRCRSAGDRLSAFVSRWSRETGQPLRWDLAADAAALDAGLLPLVNGDVIFDEQRGGTILSTEDVCSSTWLASCAAPHPAGRARRRRLG